MSYIFYNPFNLQTATIISFNTLLIQGITFETLNFFIFENGVSIYYEKNKRKHHSFLNLRRYYNIFAINRLFNFKIVIARL